MCIRDSFGTDQYAYEELVAEMCSCFMGAELTTQATPSHIENHKAYVQSWIQAVSYTHLPSHTLPLYNYLYYLRRKRSL